MYTNILKIIGISLIGITFTACTNVKTADLSNTNIDLKSITSNADIAIKNNNIKVNEIDMYMKNEYPILMKQLEDFDLRFDYKNNITTLLICKNDLAVIEDLSCDNKINAYYKNENLACNFYIENPKCN